MLRELNPSRRRYERVAYGESTHTVLLLKSSSLRAQYVEKLFCNGFDERHIYVVLCGHGVFETVSGYQAHHAAPGLYHTTGTEARQCGDGHGAGGLSEYPF